MSDSESSSSKSNKDDNVDNIEKDGSSSSSKQRFSDAYKYFTFNQSTSSLEM